MGAGIVEYMFLLFVLAAAVAEGIQQPCLCKNGGECYNSGKEIACRCPTEYVGKFCETKTIFISSNSILTDLNENYTYLAFGPSQPNYYKFTLQVCMAYNPHELESLIFMEVQKEDGSIDGEPSFFSSSKMKIKEGECMSFSTQFIEIRMTNESPPPKIVFGIKTLKQSFKNYFFKSISGNNHRDIPQTQQLTEASALQSPEQFTQRLFFKVGYQLYQQTTAEKILRTVIKVMLFILVILFVFIFTKLTLYSYNIESREILMLMHKTIKIVCRKICPSRRAKRYGRYLVLRMQDSLENRDLRQNDQCAICLQPFDDNEMIMETDCNHIYHESCLDGWSLKNETCPLCRQLLISREKGWLGKLVEG